MTAIPPAKLARILQSVDRAYDAYADGERDMDFEWFACDEKDHLGVFTTGAQLDAPPVVLGDKQAFLDTTRLILELPEIGTAVPRNPSVWIDFGARGLFGFDVPSTFSGLLSYERQFVPSSPILASALPLAVQRYLDRVRLDVDFARDALIRLG